MVKTLVFGSINIDFTYHLDHIIIPGETLGASDVTKSIGGKGANQAAALAKAGVPVYLAGKMGQDGEFILERLKTHGVNTDHVIVYEGFTGQAIIQLDKNGQNAIFLNHGGNGAITTEEINGVIRSFDKGDLILLQNEIAHVGEIITAASSRGLKVCFNPSPYISSIEQYPLDLVDIFFVNEIEGAAMACASDLPSPAILDKLTERFSKAEIIRTAGKEGAYYGYGKERAKGESVKVPVVDTVGAGDTFSGYFIAARQRNLSIQEAITFACKAASIAVSRKGAMEAVPAASEVF
jgi:ribokinase